MNVYQVDPITDVRWSRFLERHSRASLFHSVPWLLALKDTYGYNPIVFTTSHPSNELENGLIFCDINSWITGRRLVSMPFSDHCEPLCDSPDAASILLKHLSDNMQAEHWEYLEFRTQDLDFFKRSDCVSFQPTSSYSLHVLDLCCDSQSLFKSFDYDSVQRRVGRAERAGLVEKCGTSEDLLKAFYSLFEITRRRHRLPPIPYSWFQNLIRCHGEALDLRLAYKDSHAIAAILTVQFKNVVYYKYGCSDRRFHRFGAMPWLFWHVIAAAKNRGIQKFDLGRTDQDNSGLRTFKNNWVRNPEQLVYWRFPGSSSRGSFNGWEMAVAKRVFSVMPAKFLRIVGRLAYRHIG